MIRHARKRIGTSIALALALAFVGPVGADEPQAKPSPVAGRGTRPGDVQKVFIIQHIRSGELAQILSVFPAAISHSGQALGVSAAPAVVQAIEETIKRLDVPQPPAKDVELTGYVVEALGQQVPTAAVPSELDGVVAQLRRSFSYLSYRLADTIIVRGRSEQGFESSSLGGDALSPDEKTLYQLSGRVVVLPGDGSDVVRLDNLRFHAGLPVSNGQGSMPKFSRETVGVEGSVDVRPGQYIVVGKSGLVEGPNALFLILSAKLVE